MDCRSIFLGLSLGLAVPAALAQPHFASDPRSTPQQAAPAQEQRPFASAPRVSAQAQRCASFERQLGDVLLLEQQPNSTGRADQLATRREQLLLDKQKAGC